MDLDHSLEGEKSSLVEIVEKLDLEIKLLILQE
jgi:hypothetical protein